MLHWFILGFGQSGPCGDLGRTTNARQLIKLVPADDGVQPICFDRVRNTIGWPEYFYGEFNAKVLPEGKSYYHELTEQLELPRVADSLRVEAMRQRASHL